MNFKCCVVRGMRKVNKSLPQQLLLLWQFCQILMNLTEKDAKQASLLFMFVLMYRNMRVRLKGELCHAWGSVSTM